MGEKIVLLYTVYCLVQVRRTYSCMYAQHRASDQVVRNIIGGIYDKNPTAGFDGTETGNNSSTSTLVAEWSSTYYSNCNHLLMDPLHFYKLVLRRCSAEAVSSNLVKTKICLLASTVLL